MKDFLQHQLSIEKSRQELQELKSFLANNKNLGERASILPFFRARLHLSALISTYVNDIANPDRLAFELDLFGDFACDLAVGDSERGVFLLIEFEDAKAGGLFKKGTKYAPDWSSRLEHGFSQVIDWFWKLDDFKGNADYRHKFGTPSARFHGLVIIGREEQLSDREKARLKWRQEYALINSKPVSVISFDQLVTDLEFRLKRYPQAAAVDQS